MRFASNLGQSRECVCRRWRVITIDCAFRGERKAGELREIVERKLARVAEEEAKTEFFFSSLQQIYIFVCPRKNIFAISSHTREAALVFTIAPRSRCRRRSVS